MKTFFNILQKCAHSTTTTYPDEPLKFKIDFINKTNNINKPNPEYDFIKVCYVYNIVCKIYKEYNILINSSSKSKYIPFKNEAIAKLKVFDIILNSDNSFIFLKSYKDYLVNIFSKAQRIYYAFIRLAHIYRLRKNKTVVTDDLAMNPLDINNKNTFVLIQNKAKYLFSLNDIVKIIETSITHAPSFFHEPSQAKNPYNNQLLTLSTLYNIYFKLKLSQRLMSTLFHLYFLSNFDMEKFSLKNEPFIRETTIKKYIYNASPDILYKSIIKMLSSNYYTRKLEIHKDFPRDVLVEIFKPFLYYYYITNYYIEGTEIISNYKQVLYLKLKKFYEYNKSFGRKMNHATPRLFNKKNSHLLFNIKWKPFSFNTKHITFYNINININNNDNIDVLIYITQETHDDTSELDDDISELDDDTSELDDDTSELDDDSIS